MGPEPSMATLEIGQIESANVVALETESSFSKLMCQALSEREIKVQPIILKNRELSSWLKQEHTVGAFGFDFDQYKAVPHKEAKADLAKFVVRKSIERKLCLLDRGGLEIFKQQFQGPTRTS